MKVVQLAEKSSYSGNKAFLIESGESKVHVTIRKELIWGRNAFLIQNLARKRHAISRKRSYGVTKSF